MPLLYVGGRIKTGYHRYYWYTNMDIYMSCRAVCRALNYVLHYAAMPITYSGSKIDMHAYLDSMHLG